MRSREREKERFTPFSHSNLTYMTNASIWNDKHLVGSLQKKKKKTSQEKQPKENKQQQKRTTFVPAFGSMTTIVTKKWFTWLFCHSSKIFWILLVSSEAMTFCFCHHFHCQKWSRMPSYATLPRVKPFSSSKLHSSWDMALLHPVWCLS